MFFPTLLAAASLATSASAFSILTPGGPSLWWVAGSDNVVSWDCHNNPPAQTYQLLINNTSPTVLTSAQAILANLPNADCSHVITQQMVTLNAGTGYTLIIADQLDQTKQYAVSQEFEVKPVGSPFPPTSATPTGSGGASATSSGTAASGSSSPTSGSSNNNTSAATGVRASVAGVLSVLGAALYVL